MAYRLGQNTWWNFYPETSYGVISATQSTIPYVHSQTLNMQSVHSPIDRPYKSGQITPTKCGTIYGYKEGEVTLEAAFNTPLFHILMKSWLQNNYNTSSTDSTISSSIVSYTIAEYDKDNSTKWRLAKGCVVKSLQISHTRKDIVKLSATLAAKQITDWQARTAMSGSGAHYSTIGCHETVLSVGQLNFNHTDMVNSYTSFTLALDTQFMDDMFKYGRELTPSNMNAAYKTGMYTVQYPFDPSDFTDMQTKIGTAADQGDHVITIGDPNSTLNIIINLEGVYSSYNAPDPDNGTWVATGQLTLSKTEPAIPMISLVIQ